MKIPKETKQKIIADKNQLSIHQISKKYNLPKNVIKNIIEASEKKPVSKKWFYLILVLIPVIFFVVLEMLLRIFNYGYDTTQWVDAGEGKYIINPELCKSYFTSREFTPTTTEDVFDQQKKINSFRVFILGGSSALGYPYMPMGSFSRYLRRRLELSYPNTIIEVINIGMTAVNSYTLLDLMPGVLEQKPDVVLIYAGHNEFYGALGVGSNETIGGSRNFINLVLYLNKYKTTQLIRNSIRWIYSLFVSENEEDDSGTLMSSMAKDHFIPLNSEKFNAGIDQFEGNLRDILKLAKNKGVSVIVGKLVSNLKDQKPFISTNTPNYKTANQVYEDAQLEFEKNSFSKADSLFRLAKDLDALRFRAPEIMNNVIDQLCKEFKVKAVSIDSLFTYHSPDGIVGSSLIVDHLHPNLKGYQLIGKCFYEAMKNSGNLPGIEDPKFSFNIQDSITISNFLFTDLDSAIGNNIITVLKNDWPFVDKKKNKLTRNLFKQKNFVDSLALEYVENKISWSDAHLNAANHYLKRDDIRNHLKYMNVLVYQYQVLKDYNTTLKYFYDQKKINPQDFTIKRMGTIALFNKKYDDAIRYLTQSNQSDSGDIQVLYYLAVAHFEKQDFKVALNTVNRCLTIDPNYAEAIELKNRLKNKAQ